MPYLAMYIDGFLIDSVPYDMKKEEGHLSQQDRLKSALVRLHPDRVASAGTLEFFIEGVKSIVTRGPLSNVEKGMIISLHERGWNVSQIAEAVGRGAYSVQAIISNPKLKRLPAVSRKNFQQQPQLPKVCGF